MRALPSTWIPQQAPVFFDYLFEAGQVEKYVFATYFDDEESSFVQIGDYDANSKYYVGDLTWVNLIQDRHWLSTTAGFIINEKPHLDEMGSRYARLDSGSPYIYTPKKMGEKLVKKAVNGLTGFKWFGDWYLVCDQERFNSVFLEFGGYYFEIPPEAYVLDLKESLDKKWCTMGF
mmetsp:Transcript_34595/g.33806  ORF Transcript_34595/g.33806 Transcript_34595/m.33806 type:complete len:175 (+) Transcript_34595:451-975(+)